MFPHTVRHLIKRTAEVVDRRVFHSRKFMLTRMIQTRLSSDPTAGSAATRRRRVRRARRGCFRLPIAFPPSVFGAQKPPCSRRRARFAPSPFGEGARRCLCSACRFTDLPLAYAFCSGIAHLIKSLFGAAQLGKAFSYQLLCFGQRIGNGGKIACIFR